MHALTNASRGVHLQTATPNEADATTERQTVPQSSNLRMNEKKGKTKKETEEKNRNVKPCAENAISTSSVWCLVPRFPTASMLRLAVMHALTLADLSSAPGDLNQSINQVIWQVKLRAYIP